MITEHYKADKLTEPSVLSLYTPHFLSLFGSLFTFVPLSHSLINSWCSHKVFILLPFIHLSRTAVSNWPRDIPGMPGHHCFVQCVCVYMSVRALPPPYSLVLRSSSGPVTIRERGRERERIGGWEKDRDREKSIKEAKERKEPLCMCFSSRASVN